MTSNPIRRAAIEFFVLAFLSLLAANSSAATLWSRESPPADLSTRPEINAGELTALDPLPRVGMAPELDAASAPRLPTGEVKAAAISEPAFVILAFLGTLGLSIASRRVSEIH